MLIWQFYDGRCQRVSEDKDSRLRELERRLQKQQREHEELVERNEELEALLGELQKAKERNERLDSEICVLRDRVRSLDTERRTLLKLKAHERLETDGERERLSLELLHVKQQLQYAREQIPKGEENKQLRQDLQRTQHLFTSAERELRYEREKNLDLKRHSALLDQEKIKLCAELKQAQAKVAQLEGSATGHVAELERLQQRVRDLELEVARSARNRQTNSSLMEELNSERARVIAADKKVCYSSYEELVTLTSLQVVELQQQLKNTLHQLRLEEARAGETSKLERDTRDLSDNLSALRARLQQEQLQRSDRSLFLSNVLFSYYHL
uniref:Uncharacterized protein n=1 Tax=Sinocyclocheilus rhinocerous TaxID=307959 RepID=A0A673KX59_9TELE